MVGTSLFRTLDFIINHPLNKEHKIVALMRFGGWQIKSRVIGGPVVHKWIGDSKFFVRSGETGLTGNVYTGLHEFREMSFVLHFLRKDDLFIDVGANVGSYTILACAVRGAYAYSFEPVPQTYQRLCDNLKLNRIEDRVKCLNIGAGDKEGMIQFTSQWGTQNHVIGPGESVENGLNVQVLPLEMVLADESPILMKIDVEGYEAAVIEGAHGILAKPSLRAVILELNESSHLYGWTEAAVVKTMTAHGFGIYSYSPFERKLMRVDEKNPSSGNAIFVRDEVFVQDRLLTSPPVNAHGSRF